MSRLLFRLTLLGVGVLFLGGLFLYSFHNIPPKEVSAVVGTLNIPSTAQTFTTATMNVTTLTIGGVAVTATAADLNKLVGIGGTTVATQLGLKAPLANPTFTGTVTMPGTGIWNSSGNVGIGTVTPDTKLDIYTAGQSTSNIKIKSDQRSDYLTTGGALGSILFGVDGGGAATPNVGAVRSMARSGQYDIGLFTYGSSLTESFTVKGDGNVGIGTMGPNAKVQINTPSGYTGDSLRIAANSEPAAYYLNLDSDVSSGLVKWHLGVENAGVWYPGNLTLDRGNVGIGTTAPGQKLDVAGNMNITGTIQNGSTVFLESAPATADIYANIRVLRSKSTFADGMYINYGGTGGTAKIYDGGTTNYITVGSGATLNVPGTVTAPTFSGNLSGTFGGLGTGSFVQWNTWNGSYLGTNGDLYLNWAGTWLSTLFSTKAPLASPTFTGSVTMPGTGIWNSSGNVGIGTAGPSVALQIGNFNSGLHPVFKIPDPASTTWSTDMYYDSTPAFNFAVSGRNLNILSGWNSTMTLNTGNSTNTSGTVNVPYGRLSVGGQTIGQSGDITANRNGTNTGAIFLGSNANSGYVYYAGDSAWMQSNRTFTPASDRRIKSEVMDISYGLEDLMKLDVKQYNFHNTSINDGAFQVLPDSRPALGLIAQDVYKIIPTAVFKPADENKTLWGIDYNGLFSVAVRSIQQLNTKIDSQQTEIVSLKSVMTDFINKFKEGLIETKKLIVDGVDILKKLNELSGKVESQQRQIEELQKTMKELRK